MSIEETKKFTVTSPQPTPLEQARRIVDQDLPDGFIPPPRSIADVLALIERTPDPDPAEWARMVAAAGTEPPPHLGGEELSRFYFDRARAAFRIGDHTRRLADLRRARALLPDPPAIGSDGVPPAQNIARVAYSSELTRSLTWAETQVARNRAEAVSLMERAITADCCNLYLFEQMVNNLLEFGDVMGIRQYAQRARDAIRQLEREGRVPDVKEHRMMALIEFRALQIEGRAQAAEPYIREAIRIFEASTSERERVGWFLGTAPPTYDVRSRRFLAFNLALQDRFLEAEIELRFTLEQGLKQRGKRHGETVAAIRDLGRVVALQGRQEEAEALLRAAFSIQAGFNAPLRWRPAVEIRKYLGATLIAQRKWRQAMAEFDAIAGDWSRSAAVNAASLYGDTLVAWALLRTGRTDEARRYAAAAFEWRREAYGPGHRRTAEALAVLAAVQAQLGERQAAVANFEEANRILLAGNWRESGEGTTAPDQEFAAATEAQLSLLADVAVGVPKGQPDDLSRRAFRLADAVQVRGAQRALAAASARLALQDPDLADLARREQDAETQARVRLRSLSTLMAAAPGQRDELLVATLRAQIDELSAAGAVLRAEIERRHPEYERLTRPQPATVDQAQAALQEGEALVSFYIGETRSFAWGVPKRGPVTFVALDLGAGEVERLVGAVRHAVDREISSVDQIPAFDVGAAHRLYAALLEPVRAAWKGADTLVVVPHGPLSRLPFGVLVTAPTTLPPSQPNTPLFESYVGVPWLVREVAIAQLPSVASLVTMRGLPARQEARRPFIGFGDPWFTEAQAIDLPSVKPTQVAAVQTRGGDGAPASPVRLRAAPRTNTLLSARLAMLPPLPETAEEVLSIARTLGADVADDVYLGRRASEQVVRTVDLSDRRIVMFATHGLAPGSLDGLAQPALALTAPQIAGGSGDGLLTVDKILRLGLNADWVVLSACDTTASRAGAGADAVSALGGAFFYAGARALLVSNWPVETVSAKLLTVELFRRQAETPGVSRSEALRRAMLDLIDAPGAVAPDTGKPVYRYAHPLFWAPFSLVGDPGTQVGASIAGHSVD